MFTIIEIHMIFNSFIILMYANLLVLVELEELEQQLCHGDAFRKELLQGGDGDGQEQQQEQQVKAEIHSHSHYYLVQVIS